MPSDLVCRTLFVVSTVAAVGCAETLAPDDFIPITTLSGDATLAAQILTPVGPGPYPAIVVVHGDGTALR